MCLGPQYILIGYMDPLGFEGREVCTNLGIERLDYRPLEMWSLCLYVFAAMHSVAHAFLCLSRPHALRFYRVVPVSIEWLPYSCKLIW